MQNVIYVNMFQQKFDDPNITRLPAPPIEVQRGRSFEVFGLSSSDLKGQATLFCGKQKTIHTKNGT